VPTPRPLTDWTTFAAYPDWSPTEDLIVFSTYDLGQRDGGSFADPSPPSDLYTMRPDGTGVTQRTHNQSGTQLMRDRTASGPLSSCWSTIPIVHGRVTEDAPLVDAGPPPPSLAARRPG
jgi:hypothetical protein